nr:hypothetical protein CFP56_31595 [Quercus suber]
METARWNNEIALQVKICLMEHFLAFSDETQSGHGRPLAMDGIQQTSRLEECADVQLWPCCASTSWSRADSYVEANHSLSFATTLTSSCHHAELKPESSPSRIIPVCVPAQLRSIWLIVCSYFKTGDFADATIQFCGGRQPVHKIVLAQGSDYFSRLFLGSFAEARSESVVLIDDGADAVHNLIAHLYGIEVVNADVTCSEAGFNIVRIQIETYAVARKYLVPALCAKIEQSFAGNLASLLDLHRLGSTFTYIDRISRMLYFIDDLADEKLQVPLIALLAKHAADLAGNAEFKELNADIPDLSFELLKTLATPKKVVNSKTKKSFGTRSETKVL